MSAFFDREQPLRVDNVNSLHPKAVIHYWRNLWPDLNRNWRRFSIGMGGWFVVEYAVTQTMLSLMDFSGLN